MSKTILQISTVSSSSSDDTDSTQTQCESLPPIRNSCTFDHLPINHHQTINLQTHQLNESDVITDSTVTSTTTSTSSFRKCKSFVQLTTATGKLQNSIVDSDFCGNCEHPRKLTTAATTAAVFMAIKPDQHFFIYRIFNRCKVNFSIQAKNRKHQKNTNQLFCFSFSSFRLLKTAFIVGFILTLLILTLKKR